MLDFSARKIFTLPNYISASRIVAVPFIGWLLLIDSVPARIGAAALLAYAILSDFLDGFLARALNQTSDLGRIIDPLADKLFVILLAMELIALRDFPLWLALVIVAKDALIIGASVFVAGRKKVVMESNIIGKYAFGFQAGLVVCYFLDFPFGELFFVVGSLLLIFASLVSYGKSAAYLRQPGFLRQDDAFRAALAGEGSGCAQASADRADLGEESDRRGAAGCRFGPCLLLAG